MSRRGAQLGGCPSRDLGIIHERDVVLALSYSGESEELTHLLPAFEAIRSGDHRLDRRAEVHLGTPCRPRVLNCRVPREACPFNLAPTSSSTAMLVMGDALALAVADARGIRLEISPSGIPAGPSGEPFWCGWATSCVAATAMPWRR